MNGITLTPIGLIRTPYQKTEGMPIQPAGAAQTPGQVIVDAAFEEGLDDLDGFSHIILLYQFHQADGYDLKVTPFLDTQRRGLFATRAPRRPNPIGLSVVALTRREANVLHVAGIDVLDGTPLLDIKPFVPTFDAPVVTAVGWMAGQLDRTASTRADTRFQQPSGQNE
jgi:tRNA-Thr(GGU) m(6)t(6)A37 methyltransferase TsaA